MADNPLSDAALEALVGGTPALQPPETVEQFPTPAPEVVEAAKAILREGVESSLEVDGKQVIGKPIPIPADAITEEDKVFFVRHIMYGESFSKSYKLFGDKVRISFRSLTAEEDNRVLKTAQATAAKDSVGSVEDKYRIVKALASVFIITDLRAGEFTCDPYSDYPACLSKVSDAQLSLILEYYGHFEKLVSTLLEKADDHSFWQTPSYGT